MLLDRISAKMIGGEVRVGHNLKRFSHVTDSQFIGRNLQ